MGDGALPSWLHATDGCTCSRGWEHFLPSLRDFVETGTGSPLG
jgi:hypothetical protein